MSGGRREVDREEMEEEEKEGGRGGETPPTLTRISTTPL